MYSVYYSFMAQVEYICKRFLVLSDTKVICIYEHIYIYIYIYVIIIELSLVPKTVLDARSQVNRAV